MSHFFLQLELWFHYHCSHPSYWNTHSGSYGMRNIDTMRVYIEDWSQVFNRDHTERYLYDLALPTTQVPWLKETSLCVALVWKWNVPTVSCAQTVDPLLAISGEGQRTCQKWHMKVGHWVQPSLSYSLNSFCFLVLAIYYKLCDHITTYIAPATMPSLPQFTISSLKSWTGINTCSSKLFLLDIWSQWLVKKLIPLCAKVP